MQKNNDMGIKKNFREKYTCIIKDNKYTKQIVTGKIAKVLFEDCSFTNIIFKDMEFNNVIFYKCDFYNCSFEDSNIYYQELLVFDNCKITLGKWNNCQFSQLWCFETIININEFKGTNLFNSLFYRSTFKQVKIKENTSLEGVSIIRPIGWFDIEFDNNRGIIKVNQKTNITKFDYKTKVYDDSGKYQNDRASIFNDSKASRVQYNSDAVGETFLNFANQFKLNSLEEEYGKYYYRGKREIHKKLPLWKKFKSFIGLITCGYGEKWYYGIVTSIGLILSFSFFYMSGLELSNGVVIKYGFNPSIEGLSLSLEKVIDYGYSVYFSAMTFMVGHYGDIQAIGVLSNILSFIQMVLGSILMTIITGSILRKLFR